MIDNTKEYKEPDNNPIGAILDEVALDVFGVEFNELYPEHKKMISEEFGQAHLEAVTEGLMEHINNTKEDDTNN